MRPWSPAHADDLRHRLHRNSRTSQIGGEPSGALRSGCSASANEPSSAMRRERSSGTYAWARGSCEPRPGAPGSRARRPTRRGRPAEQVPDLTHPRRQLELELAARVAEAIQLVSDLDAFLGAIRRRHRALAIRERVGERGAVAKPARDRDGLFREQEPPLDVRRPVEGHAEPRQQLHLQRVVARVEGGERRLEQTQRAPRRPRPEKARTP